MKTYHVVALLAVATLPLSTPPIAAQQLTKGTVMTVTVPEHLLHPAGVRLIGGRIYIVTVGRGPSGPTLDGTDDWLTSGFPAMIEAAFEKVSPGKQYTEVE